MRLYATVLRISSSPLRTELSQNARNKEAVAWKQDEVP